MTIVIQHAYSTIDRRIDVHIIVILSTELRNVVRDQWQIPVSNEKINK